MVEEQRRRRAFVPGLSLWFIHEDTMDGVSVTAIFGDDGSYVVAGDQRTDGALG